MNAARPCTEIEESFAHEIAHAYYDRRISRLFKKREEDLIDWAVIKFCKENTGYLRGALADIMVGKAYQNIRTCYIFWQRN